MHKTSVLRQLHWMLNVPRMFGVEMQFTQILGDVQFVVKMYSLIWTKRPFAISLVNSSKIPRVYVDILHGLCCNSLAEPNCSEIFLVCNHGDVIWDLFAGSNKTVVSTNELLLYPLRSCNSKTRLYGFITNSLNTVDASHDTLCRPVIDLHDMFLHFNITAHLR